MEFRVHILGRGGGERLRRWQEVKEKKEYFRGECKCV